MRDLLRLLPLLLLSSLLLTCQHSTESTQEILPPTSHVFNWTSYSLGVDGRNSFFSDVSIANDTLVYLSGQISVTDSTGQVDPNPANAVRWNGREWVFRKIPYYVVCGIPDLAIFRTESVVANDAGHIQVLGSDQVARFADLDSATLQCIPNNIYLTKLFGNSPTNLYAVGWNGTIFHFDGSRWQLQPASTSVTLKDVCGSSDGKTVFASGYSANYFHSALLGSTGQGWSILWANDSSSSVPPYGYIVVSVWPGKQNLYVGTVDGIYRSPLSNITSAQQVLTTGSPPMRIRGSAENNIAAACDNGSIWHFNGETWANVVTADRTKPLKSIAVSERIIVAVGFDASSGNGTKGRVVIGVRP